jgi:chaperonin GroEL (HSP60 family)
MSAVQYLNHGAEVVRKTEALAISISAAKGMQEVLKSCLGPKGTMKMYVYGTKTTHSFVHSISIADELFERECICANSLL